MQMSFHGKMIVKNIFFLAVSDKCGMIESIATLHSAKL